MNKEIFKTYESDIARIGGFGALPEMHRQAYEIIKEASADFTDWDQLIAVAEEPDIQKLIQIHLEWLNEKMEKSNRSSKSPVQIPEKTKKTKTQNVLKKKWWITRGTVSQRLELIIDMLVHTRMDAFDEEEELIAGVEMEIRDLLEKPDDISRDSLSEIYAGWQNMVDNQSVNDVQESLVKISQEFWQIIRTLPKPSGQKKSTVSTKSVKAKPDVTKPTKVPRQFKTTGKVIGGEVRYTDDVKFIRSFLTLTHGDQGKTRMVNFYKRMAKANAERRFSDSKHKTVLNEIAGALHDSINNGKNKVSMAAGLKEKLLGIKGNHQLSASVKVIKRFYNMIGETPTIKQAELLLKSAERIGESDSYYPDVQRILYRLRRFLNKEEKSISIDQPTIQGLAGVLKTCGCKLSHGNWEDAVRKKG
jgi:hypothetical protein